MSHESEVIDYIKKLTPGQLESLQRYFRKFILDTGAEIKNTCCLKYCNRLSFRHCVDCPIHPMLDGNEKPDTEIIKTCNEYLDNKQYVEFVLYLEKNNFPYPDTREMEKLLSEN